MTLETATINDRQVCKLSGALSIWEAVSTWEQLHDLIRSKSKDPLDIDLSGVDSCDCAGIQIVCQIRTAAAKKKDKIRITGVSDALVAIMSQAGLDVRAFAGASEEE